MKNKLVAAAVAVGTLGLLGGVGIHAQQNSNSNMSSGSSMNQNSNMGDKKMAGSLSSQDRRFMQMSAMTDMNEIMMAQAALQKSQNDEVKSYAQKMIDDHTTLSNSAKPVAEQKGVALPATLDAKHQAMMARMQSLSGEAFDREYLKANVKGHADALKEFDREIARGADADVKGLAQAGRPTVAMHLEMARGMEGKMKGMTGGKKMNDKKMNDKKMSNSNSSGM